MVFRVRGYTFICLRETATAFAHGLFLFVGRRFPMRTGSHPNGQLGRAGTTIKAMGADRL